MTSRIKGPGGPRKVGGVDGTSDVGEVRQTEKAGEAKKVGPTDAIARVAAQLRAGEIDIDRAVDLLIEHTVDKVGGGARPQTVDKLRKVLRDYAKSDPNLTARIRKLTLIK